MKQFFKRLFRNNYLPTGAVGRFYVRGMNLGHSPLAKFALRQVHWQPGWNVLDIGCGGGANVARLLKLCREGKVYGIDISEESVAVSSRKNRRELGRRCFIEKASADSIPHPDGTFDAVTAFETVYFWPDLDKAFLEVRRVLKRGGLFLICLQVTDPECIWKDWIENMKVYTEVDLKSKLEECGFSNIEIHKEKSGRLCVVGRN